MHYARTTAAVAECATRTTAKCLVRKNSSVFKMQSSCEAPCCSIRSRNLTTNVQPTKDESLEATNSLEAFIEFHTLFLTFIRFSNRIDRSKSKISKKCPNATQVLKNRRLLSSAVPSVWPNLPKYLTCEVPASRSETASAWRHEKEVLLHRRLPNFELVEINSTLISKELSVNKFKRIFEDAKTDECLTDAVEAFEIVSTWNWR